MAQPDRSDLDPITVEIVRHKLDGIANEMQSTLLRSSFSPIVKEGLDASASLFTPDGTTLAQSCSIPIHLATLIPAVAAVLQAYPIATMRDGDAFILNDPYAGGTHLPDIAVIMPVFHRGRVIALSAAMTHHQDVGGMTAGSVPTNATEIFQEGLRIPPLKLRDAGVLNETLLALLRRNVRIPDTVIGDLNAQIAACTVGIRRISELAERYGDNQLTRIVEELLRRSELMTRRALRDIPEGTYRFVDFLDNDGIELDRQIRIEVAVTLDDGAIEIDFTGTSPQVRGPFNCVPSGSLAAACWAVRALTDPKIPTNGGCFRPISLHLPPGSLVNPEEPAPVNARTSTIKRIAGVIVGALAQVMPERAPAASAGELLVLAFGGYGRNGGRVCGRRIDRRRQWRRRRRGRCRCDRDRRDELHEPAGGSDGDRGADPHSPRGAAAAIPEVPENGAAAWERCANTRCSTGEVSFSHRGERHFSAASGLAGGCSGASARSVIRRADGSEEVIPSKITTTLGKGDRLVVETAGGGGYGDPRRRSTERVAADIRNGKVSHETARASYDYDPPLERSVAIGRE